MQLLGDCSPAQAGMVMAMHSQELGISRKGWLWIPVRARHAQKPSSVSELARISGQLDRMFLDHCTYWQGTARFDWCAKVARFVRNFSPLASRSISRRVRWNLPIHANLRLDEIQLVPWVTLGTSSRNLTI